MSHQTKSKIESHPAPAAVVEPVTADAPENSEAVPVAATNSTPVTQTEITRIAKLQDQILRIKADFDNFRKRTSRERDAWHERAVESVLFALLPALDSLNLGLQHAVEQKMDKSHIDGLRLVVDELQAVLRKFSVTPIETAGQPFDVRWQEALAYLPSSEVAAENVIQETRAGYRIGEALLRPAQVIVSSGPPPPATVIEAAPEHTTKSVVNKNEG